MGRGRCSGNRDGGATLPGQCRAQSRAAVALGRRSHLAETEEHPRRGALQAGVHELGLGRRAWSPLLPRLTLASVQTEQVDTWAWALRSPVTVSTHIPVGLQGFDELRPFVKL